MNHLVARVMSVMMADVLMALDNQSDMLDDEYLLATAPDDENTVVSCTYRDVLIAARELGLHDEFGDMLLELPPQVIGSEEPLATVRPGTPPWLRPGYLGDEEEQATIRALLAEDNAAPNAELPEPPTEGPVHL